MEAVVKADPDRRIDGRCRDTIHSCRRRRHSQAGRQRCARALRKTSLDHRYYDPTTGSFLSVDPLVSTTTSPYEYATGDPVNNTDQTGDAATITLTRPTQSARNDELGPAVEADAAESVGLCPEAAVVIGVSFAFNVATESSAGGEYTDPILFGQRTISPAFQQTTPTTTTTNIPITATPNGSPVHVFLWNNKVVAINNRTLANYSIHHIEHPPITLTAPSGRQRRKLLQRLRKTPLWPQTSLPSLVTTVTANQNTDTPIPLPGTAHGIVVSIARAKINA